MTHTTHNSPARPSPAALTKLLEREFTEDRSSRTGRAKPRPVRLTGRDLRLLRFVSVQRFVTAPHVTRWAAADRSVAYRLLSRLTLAGLLSYQRIFHAQAGIFQVTWGGLAVIDSPLARPKVDLRTYRHDLGTVDLWLDAKAGRFGPCARLLSERELRHHDKTSEPGEPAWGVRTGRFDRHGKPSMHYPDLLVIPPHGAWVAVELELSLKGRVRLGEILVAYLLDERIRQAVYLTDQPHVLAKLREEINRAQGGEKLVAAASMEYRHFVRPERQEAAAMTPPKHQTTTNRERS